MTATIRNDLDLLTAKLIEFRDARRWGRYHTPGSLAKAISAEAGELLHLYLWDDEWQSTIAGTEPPEAAEEVADVLIYCLLFCHEAGIDPESAILAKIEKNAEKYPA